MVNIGVSERGNMRFLLCSLLCLACLSSESRSLLGSRNTSISYVNDERVDGMLAFDYVIPQNNIFDITFGGTWAWGDTYYESSGYYYNYSGTTRLDIFSLSAAARFFYSYNDYLKPFISFGYTYAWPSDIFSDVSLYLPDGEGQSGTSAGLECDFSNISAIFSAGKLGDNNKSTSAEINFWYDHCHAIGIAMSSTTLRDNSYSDRKINTTVISWTSVLDYY